MLRQLSDLSPEEHHGATRNDGIRIDSDGRPHYHKEHRGVGLYIPTRAKQSWKGCWNNKVGQVRLTRIDAELRYNANHRTIVDMRGKRLPSPNQSIGILLILQLGTYGDLTPYIVNRPGGIHGDSILRRMES